MTLLEYWEKNRPRNYQTTWVHKWICSLVERAYLERKNVIIEVSPRSGKSEICNVYGPGWRLDSDFTEAIGLVCNSDSLAQKFSRAARNMVKVPLDADRNNQWRIAGTNSLDYSYHASGIRGQMTGTGFSALHLDDTIKSGAESKSEVVRQSIWENVCSAAITRLSPRGIVICLQARFHLQDTVGMLLEQEHMKFLRLHIPATNDTGDQAYFHDGYSGEHIDFPAYASYWPERWPRERLNDIKDTSGPYYWSALYQQAPSLGAMQYFDLDKCARHSHPTADICWVAVDAANTATSHGSFTAFVGMGFDNATGRLKVISVRRGRWRQDQMHVELVDFYLEMQRLTGRRPESVIVEQAAAGWGIIDGLSHKLPIEPLIPKGSKEDRASSVCYLVNRGSVSLPDGAPWLKQFIDEVGSFPLCAHNDVTDAFGMCLAYPVRPSEFKPKDMVIRGNAPMPEWDSSPRFELDEIDEELDRLGYMGDPL
ncbi:MAG TPA: hypothetical protein VKR59_04635 [Terriglobales bacterium]|nr:hypothetical protein [Terriglobales bacterium]